MPLSPEDRATLDRHAEAMHKHCQWMEQFCKTADRLIESGGLESLKQSMGLLERMHQFLEQSFEERN